MTSYTNQGFTARKGSYYGTTDDRADRWYITVDGEDFRPWGQGYRTRREALEAAAEHISNGGA